MRSQNQRSLLRWLWLFLPAAATALAATYVRSKGILHFDTPGMPYPVFVFAGTILWQVFVEALSAPLTQLTNNRHLITRLSFPHEALILAGIWMVLLNAASRFIVLIPVCLFLHVGVAPTALLIPIGIVALATVGLAIGLLIAPIGLLYDDLGRGLTIVTTFLFFLMPVAYPISAQGWQLLNPVLPLINVTRSWLVGPAAPGNMAAPLAAASLLVIAWPFYRLARPHIVERQG